MPLITGAQNGHEAIVRVLREAGADVNKAADNGGTPLCIAALWGREAIVHILKDAGAV